MARGVRRSLPEVKSIPHDSPNINFYKGMSIDISILVTQDNTMSSVVVQDNDGKENLIYFVSKIFKGGGLS